MQQELFDAITGFVSDNPKAVEVYVTTDNKVFGTPEEAVNNAVTLSPGNPTVDTIKVEDVVKKVPLVKLSKEEAVKKASNNLEKAKADFAKKEEALNKATPTKKESAQVAFDKAKALVEATQFALDEANKLPNDQNGETK